MEITNGKCLLSFDVAAPIQITRNTILDRDDHVDAAEEEGHRHRRVDLAARGQEDHLVAQPQHSEDQQDQHDLRRRQQPDLGAEFGDRPGAVGEQRPKRRQQQRGIQEDINRLAGGALGQRDTIRPRWQPDGAEPHPVQDRTHRRKEPVVQRPEAATKPDHFEQHRVEHDLLEDDRLGPPRRDVREPAQSFGGRREEPPDKDVEQDFDDVEQMQRDRRAEAHLGPVAGHRTDLLAAGALVPFGDVDLRQVGLEESHGLTG